MVYLSIRPTLPDVTAYHEETRQVAALTLICDRLYNLPDKYYAIVYHFIW